MRNILIVAGGVVAVAAIAGAVYFGTRAPASGPPPVAAASAPSKAGLETAQPGDHVLGDANAPITVIEYASLTCSHCAHFHTQVLPEIKKKWIDTGKVKLVYRDFPLDRVALQAAQVARCVPTERYYAFLEVLFRQQEQWTAGRDPAVMIDRVKQFAALAGLPRERANACVDDQAMQMKIVGAAQAGERDHKVSGTPTFIINGRRHTGGPAFEDLDKALRDALAKP